MLWSSALLLRLGWKSLTMESLTTANLLERLTLDGIILAGEMIPPLLICIDAALNVRFPGGLADSL